MKVEKYFRSSSYQTTFRSSHSLQQLALSISPSSRVCFTTAPGPGLKFYSGRHRPFMSGPWVEFSRAQLQFGLRSLFGKKLAYISMRCRCMFITLFFFTSNPKNKLNKITSLVHSFQSISQYIGWYHTTRSGSIHQFKCLTLLWYFSPIAHYNVF